MTERLVELFPAAGKGELTRRRADLVCEECLSEREKELDLFECLRLGKGMEKQCGRWDTSARADALEAFLGALYLDGGFFEASRFVRETLFPEGLVLGKTFGTDPKSMLQERCQELGKAVPEYFLVEKTGQEEGDSGKSRDDHEGEKESDNKGNCREADLLHGETADPRADEEVDRHGRSHLADCHVDRHHDAEPDGIPSEDDDDGGQDGKKDVEDGDGVQKHPGEEQDDVDHEKDDHRVFRYSQKDGRHRVDESHGGSEPGVEPRAGHHDHDDGGSRHGLLEDVIEYGDGEGFIDENSHEEAVEDCNGGGFRGGEYPAVDSSEDDDGGEEPPEGIPDRPENNGSISPG